MSPRLNPETLEEKVCLVERALPPINHRSPTRRPRLINNESSRARSLDNELDASPASMEELSGTSRTSSPAPSSPCALEERHRGPIHFKDRSLPNFSSPEPYPCGATIRSELTAITPVRLGRPRDTVAASLELAEEPRRLPLKTSPSRARIELNPRSGEELWVALGIFLEALIARADHRTIAPKELRMPAPRAHPPAEVVLIDDALSRFEGGELSVTTEVGCSLQNLMEGSMLDTEIKEEEEPAPEEEV